MPFLLGIQRGDFRQQPGDFILLAVQAHRFLEQPGRDVGSAGSTGGFPTLKIRVLFDHVLPKFILPLGQLLFVADDILGTEPLIRGQRGKTKVHMGRFLVHMHYGGYDCFGRLFFLDEGKGIFKELFDLPRLFALEKFRAGGDYAHNFIFDSIRSYQMGKESWSLPSLTTYKKIRTAAWMQNNLENAVEAFMEKYKCRRKTADRFFREANCLHRRKETILLDDEEEERDILPELAGEEADDVSQIIWHEIHANAVRKAFDRLTSDEKEYLQRRNAVCMKCNCARNIKYGESFDDLGAHFELTTANGAEKAYRKAVDHLTRLLVEDNAICAVTVKKKVILHLEPNQQYGRQL